MVGAIVIAAITYMCMRNSSDPSRLWPCVITLWITTASYMLYTVGAYDQTVALIGYYQYQSIAPLICVLALSLVKGRLATALMMTASFLIVANVIAFWTEGVGIYAWGAHQIVVWVILIVELALMHSPGLTNGLHRAIYRADTNRDHNKGLGVSNYLPHSSKDNVGKTP